MPVDRVLAQRSSMLAYLVGPSASGCHVDGREASLYDSATPSPRAGARAITTASSRHSTAAVVR